MTRNALILAAVGEGLTGLALVLAPSLVGELLLGEALVGFGAAAARVAGIALIGLAVACWPGPPRLGMLTYSALVTVYLGYLGVTGMSGVLLWPAVVLHLVLTAALALAPKQPAA
jgi:purine-cytosine permease-like protein